MNGMIQFAFQCVSVTCLVAFLSDDVIRFISCLFCDLRRPNPKLSE